MPGSARSSIVTEAPPPWSALHMLTAPRNTAGLKSSVAKASLDLNDAVRARPGSRAETADHRRAPSQKLRRATASPPPRPDGLWPGPAPKCSCPVSGCPDEQYPEWRDWQAALSFEVHAQQPLSQLQDRRRPPLGRV